MVLAAVAVDVVDQDRPAMRVRLGDVQLRRDHGRYVDLRHQEARTSFSTSLESEVRASCMVSTTPSILRRGLSVADLVDGFLQLRYALQREELALHRHQYRIGRRKCIQRKQIKRWRAVDQNIA